MNIWELYHSSTCRNGQKCKGVLSAFCQGQIGAFYERISVKVCLVESFLTTQHKAYQRKSNGEWKFVDKSKSQISKFSLIQVTKDTNTLDQCLLWLLWWVQQFSFHPSALLFHKFCFCLKAEIELCGRDKRLSDENRTHAVVTLRIKLLCSYWIWGGIFLTYLSLPDSLRWLVTMQDNSNRLHRIQYINLTQKRKCAELNIIGSWLLVLVYKLSKKQIQICKILIPIKVFF